ncbi:hypothetical protein DPMN_042131 [Dreissena polymorpha]|uniref:Uncharacterized protein n=1 Tax=Dreissena polymorpha TaxID=45954 RepID=A0A9D4HUH9_DREPO|nr:hypothetical protein DPMN_042131 [Dreissena polymorpha]
MQLSRCLYHVTFSAMCGTIGCQQTIASECHLFGNSVVERSKHSRESPNTKPPTHGKENISVAANLFL